jgi:N-glycosylase/DNA lyase
MNENLKPIQIAKKIIKLSGVDIFENNRRKNQIEFRSLLCYLLREKLNMRWTYIAKFFSDNNKTMTHATCMHAVRNYKMYKKTNKKLDEIEKLFTFKSKLNIDEIDRVHYLENKCKLLESKYQSPLYEMIRNIPEDKETEAIERIGLMLEGWNWKNKI